MINDDYILPPIIGVGLYNSALYRQSGETSPRTTAFYELELSTDEGGLLHLGGTEQRIRPGLAVITKPGLLRWTSVPYRCYYIHLAPVSCGLCRELYRLPDAIDVEIDAAERLFSDALGFASEDPSPHGVEIRPEGAALRLYAKLFEIIALLSSASREVEQSSKPIPPAIAAALSLIDITPERCLTLEELASAVHMSPVYFHRLFKRVIGQTPYRFMLEKKLTLAKNLLLTTDRSCQDIAGSLGFSSPSYFSSVFRRETGVSPAEFRQRW